MSEFPTAEMKITIAFEGVDTLFTVDPRNTVIRSLNERGEEVTTISLEGELKPIE